MTQTQIFNFINGEFRPPQLNQFLPNYNPGIGQIYSEVANSTEADLEQAVSAASRSFPAWSSTTVQARSQILRKMGELILENLEELSLAESVDTGKPLSLAKMVDIPRSAQNFFFFADAITQFASQSHFMNDPVAINYTLRKPLGVVALISPWNLPLYLLTWKIAPALAAGNCLIAKPSELSPMTANLLAKLSLQAGLPPGVLNICHGEGQIIGEKIIHHPQIKAVSFTGGTKTGAYIATQVAPSFKKFSLELGGKNPNIIFADCDYPVMMETTLKSSFNNQGQICLAGSRIFVEENLYAQFKNDFLARTKNLKVGAPQDPQTQIGAVISQSHCEKILSYIELAKTEGGKILCGGHQVKLGSDHQNGWYISPTIIEGLSPYSPVNQEEIFGPLVTLTPFKHEDEVLKYANSTRYGLSATLWTTQLKRAHTLAEKLDCGMVWINCWMLRDLRTPFGGQKQSGFGREGGWESLTFFSDTKNICVKY